MGLKDLIDGIIAIFRAKNLIMIPDFDGVTVVKDSVLTVNVDEILQPFPGHDIFKIKLTFTGRTKIDSDKTKSNIYALQTATRTTLKQITVSDLNAIVGDVVVAWEIDDNSTFDSNEEEHTFTVAYSITLQGFEL